MYVWRCVRLYKLNLLESFQIFYHLFFVCVWYKMWCWCPQPKLCIHFLKIHMCIFVCACTCAHTQTLTDTLPISWWNFWWKCSLPGKCLKTGVSSVTAIMWISNKYVSNANPKEFFLYAKFPRKGYTLKGKCRIYSCTREGLLRLFPAPRNTHILPLLLAVIKIGGL